MHLRRLFRPLFALAFTLLLAGCETTEMVNARENRTAVDEGIKAETPGKYYIGRRYYKVDYKFWGWVREPGQPWSTAKMVMLNEQGKLAPDREQGHIGSDNGYEYKFYGSFSNTPVYEPASNTVYPEFVLTGYELVSAAPPNIYRTPGALDPARRVIAHPY